MNMLNLSQFRSSDHDQRGQFYSIVLNKKNALNQIAGQNTNTPNTRQFRGFAATREMVDSCR